MTEKIVASSTNNAGLININLTPSHLLRKIKTTF